MLDVVGIHGIVITNMFSKQMKYSISQLSLCCLHLKNSYIIILKIVKRVTLRP